METNRGTYAGAGNTGSEPNAYDSDGDQYPDGYEVQRGGNPVNNTILPTTLPAGIVLGVVTDEASTGISDTKTYTHKISGDGAATVNGVALDALTDVATPANFSWTTAGGKNIVTSASGSYHLYGLTNNESGPPPPLDFASVVRAADGSSMTLTIASRPGRTYAVDYSTDLVNWVELTDSARATYRARGVTP